ncbi:MAG: TonB-dependent receptor [Pyrinomonadaceae bacterium]|nr:MAG: TonB-dependent receptor [Pyrinomonadaceae bacterium]
MRRLLFILGFFLFSNVVFAQSANLALQIRDLLGGLIQGASVEVKGVVSRTAQTDDKGSCLLKALPMGKYQVAVTAKGFASKIVEVELDGESKTIEIVLVPAPAVAYVSVTSNYLAGKPESLEVIPGSFQTIDKDSLENARFFTPSEALRRIAGVYTREEEGFGLRPNISIRGTLPTRSTKVLLLEDGIPLTYAPYGDNASYYHPPIERFESVEVVKGSGQIGYGPVTVAGVVNYITPNPPQDTALSIKAFGGNRDVFDGNISFGKGFGKTGLILNFTRKQGQGARDNVRIGLSDFSSKLVQQLNNRNYLTFKFSHLKEDSRVTYSGLTEAEYASNPRQNPFRNDSFSLFRTGFSVQHTSIVTAQSSLVTTFYINYFSRDWWRQSSNSNERPNRLGNDPDCRGMQDLYTTCGNQGRLRDYLTWGIEPRYNANFKIGDVNNDLSFGIRIHWEKQDRLQKNGDLPLSRDGVIVENNLRKNLAFAGFVQNRFIWKGLAVTPGVRVEHIKYKRTNRLNNTTGETELTEVIPGLGLAYNLFSNTTIFAGVHRGFAPPRTEDIISNNGGVVDLESEKSWNYELGIRTRPFDGLRVESTFFRMDYSNQIVPASLAGGVGATFTNGGKTLHQGIEIFARLDSADILKSKVNFYVQTAYTNLQKAEFRGVRYSSVNTSVLVTGNRLPYTPKTLLDLILGVTYKNFDGFLENNYISRQFSDDLNTITPTPNGQRGLIGAQNYWNVTVNYRIEKWKTVLFMTTKNLFDKTFIVDRSRGILPSSPRLVQLGFKWSLR